MCMCGLDAFGTCIVASLVELQEEDHGVRLHLAPICWWHWLHWTISSRTQRGSFSRVWRGWESALPESVHMVQCQKNSGSALRISGFCFQDGEVGWNPAGMCCVALNSQRGGGWSLNISPNSPQVNFHHSLGASDEQCRSGVRRRLGDVSPKGLEKHKVCLK